MQKIKLSFLGLLVTMFTVVYADNLYGAWHCEMNNTMSDVTTKANADVTYRKNGSFEKTGKMSLISNSGNLSYTYLDSGQWSLQEKTLTEIRTAGKVIEEKPKDNPLIEMVKEGYKVPNAQKSKVLILTNDKLQLDYDGLMLDCKK